MTSSRLLVLSLASVAAGCQTYAQHRAALVPHASPLPIDGQPMPAAGAIGLGASNIADPVAPTAGAPNVGDAVPGTQLRGELALRLGHDGAMWGVYERGLAATAHAVTSSQPPVDNGDVAGTGIGVGYSVATSNPHWRVGLAAEVVAWLVPWVQYTSCVSNCAGDSFTTNDRGTDLVPTLSLGVTPSYRNGPLTVFGGATARNQPTIAEKIETVLPSNDADVQDGPWNLTLHAGVEYAFSNALTASVFVDQTVTRDPIAGGPGFGAMVRIPLGAR